MPSWLPESYMTPIAVSCGSLCGGMKLRRRSSSGSIPSSWASWSMVTSIMWVASGRPAPRMASVGNLFVRTPMTSVCTAGNV